MALRRSEFVQISLRRQFNICAQSIRPSTSLEDQLARCAGNSFQMDVAAESVLRTQRARDLYQLLHGVIGTLDHTGTEEQPLDVVPLVELNCQRYNFARCKARAWCIARNAIHTIGTVVNTIVREENLQKGNTTAVGCIAVQMPTPSPFPRPPSGRFEMSRYLRSERRTWLRPPGS